MGPSTSPAKANEGVQCIDHRAALALPVLPGQVHVGDAASDVRANAQWRRDRGGIAVLADKPRNADRSTAALVERTIRTAYPLPPVAAWVAPTATTLRPPPASTSVADPVRPRNNSDARPAPVSWAIAIA